MYIEGLTLRESNLIRDAINNVVGVLGFEDDVRAVLSPTAKGVEVIFSADDDIIYNPHLLDITHTTIATKFINPMSTNDSSSKITSILEGEPNAKKL